MEGCALRIEGGAFRLIGAAACEGCPAKAKRSTGEDPCLGCPHWKAIE